MVSLIYGRSPAHLSCTDKKKCQRDLVHLQSTFVHKDLFYQNVNESREGLLRLGCVVFDLQWVGISIRM
jgi:hypothetical protein